MPRLKSQQIRKPDSEMDEQQVKKSLEELRRFKENLKFKEQEVVKRESELTMLETTIAEQLGLPKFSEKKVIDALEKMKEELNRLAKTIVADYHEIMEEVDKWKSPQIS